MVNKTPLEVILNLVDSRKRGDIETALACYEEDAAVVVEPGKIGRGREAIKAFTEATAKLNITFGKREIIEGGDLALHYSKWRLLIPDAAGGTSEIYGCTTDIIRRQPNDTWLLAVDNAWGVALLDAG